MNKKPKVNNTSFFTQRELFMFVWLKNDKKDIADSYINFSNYILHITAK